MSATIKILKLCGDGKARVARTVLLASAFAAAALVGTGTAEGALASATSSAAPSDDTATRHTTGVAEILKMLDAGVSKDVVKAYIENSPIAYRPSADEVIALHKRGASEEIITALLNHGAEVRQKMAQATQTSPGPPAQPSPPQASDTYAPTAAYAPVAQPAYPDYSYAYSYPVYPGYSYVSPYFYSSFGFYPFFSYYHPHYGYRPWYSCYGYRSCYPRYSYRPCYPHFASFHAASFSRVHSAGFASVHHGGAFVGRRR